MDLQKYNIEKEKYVNKIKSDLKTDVKKIRSLLKMQNQQIKENNQDISELQELEAGQDTIR
jgi:dynactin complex subunit